MRLTEEKRIEFLLTMTLSGRSRMEGQSHATLVKLIKSFKKLDQQGSGRIRTAIDEGTAGTTLTALTPSLRKSTLRFFSRSDVNRLSTNHILKTNRLTSLQIAYCAASL